MQTVGRQVTEQKQWSRLVVVVIIKKKMSATYICICVYVLVFNILHLYTFVLVYYSVMVVDIARLIFEILYSLIWRSCHGLTPLVHV